MNCWFTSARLLLVVIIVLIWAGPGHLAYATPYYVSSAGGSTSSDSYDGLSATYTTGNHGPWKTLTKASSHTFVAGDQLLLKSGDTWMGQVLNLKGDGGDGTTTPFILLSSYGGTARPKIAPAIPDEACINITNHGGWKIMNLELYDAMNGILIENDGIVIDYVWIENCFIHDIDDSYNTNPHLYNHCSSGIEWNSHRVTGNPKVMFTNLTIINVTFDNCNAATWMGAIFQYVNASGFGGASGVLDRLTMQDCNATNGSQWGYNVIFCQNGTITNCNTDNIGFGRNDYGSAAIVVSWCQSLTFVQCNLTNTHRGPQNYDGCGFDFEGGTAPDGTNQHDITLKSSTITNTDGCAIFVFNNNGKTTQNLLIDNVKVSHFGLDPGTQNAKHAVFFAVNSGQAVATGTIQNSVFNRNITSIPFFSGNSSGITFINNQTKDVPSKVWGFENATGGASAWTPLTGSWSLVTDGSQAYRQTNTTGTHRSLAGNTSWTNYAMQARIKRLSGNAIRLIVRYQNELNFYFLEATQTQFSLYRRAGGINTLLGATATISFAPNVWYTMKIELNGPLLKAYFGGSPATLGVPKISVTDPIPLNNGQVCLNTFDAAAHFDDVMVTDLDGGGLRKAAEEPLRAVLVVYPNPVREQLQVQYVAQQAGEVSAELHDVKGQSVATTSQSVEAGEVNLSLPVDKLPVGLYLLRVIQGSRQFSQKVLITN